MRPTIGALALILTVGSVSPAQVTAPLPDLGNTEVTLSWQDFKALVEATRVAPTPAPAPPRDAVLRSAEYSGRLDEGVLLVDVVMRLEVLRDGWVQLPLWSQGSLVSFNGDGAVASRDAQSVTVIARGPRSYDIRARLAVDAPSHPGENRLDLQLPDAAVNLLDISSGPQLRDLTVASAIVYRSQPNRIFAAAVGGRASLAYTVPYRSVEAESGDEITLEPRVLLTSSELLDLGDGVMSGVLVTDYQVRVAEVSQFELGLDDGVEVFEVGGDGIEGWSVVQRDGQRFLRIRMASPVEGATRLITTFDGSYDADSGRFQAPRFEPVGVERESGFLAVAADGAEVELEAVGNLLPADVSEIPEDVRRFGGNLITALKFSGSPDRATVTVLEHEDAAVLTAIISQLNASTVLLADGTEATWLDLAVTNNRRQFLRLELPEQGVEVWSLLVDGEPARPKQAEDRILIPLPTDSSERTSQISLVLLRRDTAVPMWGSAHPTLPGLDLPVSQALWTVYLPPDRRFRPLEDGFRVVGVTAPLRGRNLRSGGFAGLASAPSSSMEGYVSDRLMKSQVAQEEQLQQQVTTRQNVNRRGSLPVRIALPDGVTSMPLIAVARVLMVERGPTSLTIRVYPGWLRRALDGLQVLLILAAGLAVGFALGRRLDQPWRRWVAVLVVVALVPKGGIGIAGSAVWIAVLGLATAAVVVVHRAWRNRSARRRVVPPPLDG